MLFRRRGLHDGDMQLSMKPSLLPPSCFQLCSNSFLVGLATYAALSQAYTAFK